MTLAQANAADDAARTSGWIALAAFAATGIVYLVWFWHARIRADGFDPEAHRRARAWTFWGWICVVRSVTSAVERRRALILADPALR